MDVGDLLRRLLRRTRLVVVVLVVAVFAAGVSWSTAGSSLQSGAAAVIVPPTLGTAVSDQNPLLNLNDNLAELATVLSAAMNSADATALLKARGATASFTISTITGNNPSFARLSPQLVFTATGAGAAVVERTATGLISVARAQLARLQSDAQVPAAARAVLVQVVAPTAAEDVGGGRLRSAGSIGLAVLVLGLIAVLVWDEVRRRRVERIERNWQRPRGPRRRRGASSSAVTDPDAPPVFRSR